MNNPMDAFYCAIQGVGAGIGAGLGETIVPLIPFAIVFGGGLYCASYLTENLVVPWMYTHIPNVHGIDLDPSFGLPQVTPGGSVIHVPVSTGGIDIGTPYGNGRLPGFDLSVPYQMPVVSPFPLPQQTAPVVYDFDIHLGRDINEYRTWPARGYVKDPTQYPQESIGDSFTFAQLFTEVAHNARYIYFDIADVSPRAAFAYKNRESNGHSAWPAGFSGDKYGFTNWELYMLMEHTDLFYKTIFTEHDEEITFERFIEFISEYK